MLAIASISYGVLPIKFKTEKDRMVHNKLFRLYPSYLDIEKMANIAYSINKDNIEDNLILNDDYLIRFAKAFVHQVRYFDRFKTLQTATGSVKLYPASLIDEVCEQYFNRKPSNPFEGLCEYIENTELPITNGIVTYNRIMHRDYDFDNDILNYSGLVLQSSVDNYKFDTFYLFHDKNKATCEYAFECKLKLFKTTKGYYRGWFSYSKHKITDSEKQEFEEYKKRIDSSR